MVIVPVQFVACSANHNYHLIARIHFLTSQECTRLTYSHSISYVVIVTRAVQYWDFACQYSVHVYRIENYHNHSDWSLNVLYYSNHKGQGMLSGTFDIGKNHDNIKYCNIIVA